MNKILKDKLLKEYIELTDEKEALLICIDNAKSLAVKRKLSLKYMKLEIRGLNIRNMFWRDKNGR